MINEVDKAVQKATMLIPAEPCAVPLPASAAADDEAAAAALEVADVVDDMLEGKR